MNPENKMEWGENLKDEFQQYAESQIWKSDDNSTAFMGTGNVADWWLAKLLSSNLELLERVEREIEEIPRHLVKRHFTDPTIIGAVTLENIKELCARLKAELSTKG